MSDLPKRPKMTPKRRLEVWNLRAGVCYLCGLKVKSGDPWDVEHRLAFALSGDDSIDNLFVAHRLVCHKAKTATDKAIIAKANSQGMRTGQQARRARNGPKLKGGAFPKGPKQKIASRGFPKKDKSK